MESGLLPAMPQGSANTERLRSATEKRSTAGVGFGLAKAAHAHTAGGSAASMSPTTGGATSAMRPAALAARLEPPVEEWPYLDEGTLLKTRSSRVLHDLPLVQAPRRGELHSGAHLPAAPGPDRQRRAPGRPGSPWAGSRLTMPGSLRTCQSAAATSACGRHPPAPPAVAPAASSPATQPGKVPARAQPPGAPR